ncbi:hypothetical protein BDN70DRAFT_902076 [Pholiota conissans]|uniref:Uncharacterized protein n=1 Tax=Pholiota conissans TaxID=109636 RepID=A0A9P5YIE6_9AGAR|nr:hypothetical protein BDN70DRAFT_902076 [Pholiota conissans]
MLKWKGQEKERLREFEERRIGGRENTGGRIDGQENTRVGQYGGGRWKNRSTSGGRGGWDKDGKNTPRRGKILGKRSNVLGKVMVGKWEGRKVKREKRRMCDDRSQWVMMCRYRDEMVFMVFCTKTKR